MLHTIDLLRGYCPILLYTMSYVAYTILTTITNHTTLHYLYTSTYLHNLHPIIIYDVICDLL